MKHNNKKEMLKQDTIMLTIDAKVFHYVYVIKKIRKTQQEVDYFKSLHHDILNEFSYVNKQGIFIDYEIKPFCSGYYHAKLLLVYERPWTDMINRLVNHKYLGYDETNTHLRDDIPFFKSSGAIEIMECCTKKNIRFDSAFKHMRMYGNKKDPHLSIESLERMNLKGELLNKIFLNNPNCIIKRDNNNLPQVGFAENEHKLRLKHHITYTS